MSILAGESDDRPVTTYIQMVKSHYLPALLVCVVVILSALFADHQKRALSEENLRTGVSERLSLIRAKLEGNVRGNIQLVQGLVTTLQTEPRMTQPRFSELAGDLLRNKSQVIDIAAAPNLVVTMVYPLTGNEKVLGLDYQQNPRQRLSALRVRDGGRVILTGPIDLIQGGKGLVVRYPVSVKNAVGGRDFWGIVSAVIDLDKLYVDSGLRAPDLPIDVAIAVGSTIGPQAVPFFGARSTLDDDPVVMTVQFDNENWQLAAVPREGWDQLPADIWIFRFWTACVGLMVVVPMIWAGRLMQERQANIHALQQRERQLKALSHRLEMALVTSRIGIWEYDVGHNTLVWDARMRELYGVAPDKVVCEYGDWKNALHPDDIPEAERVFAETLRSDSRYESDFRLLLGSGEIRHIRSIGRTFLDADGGLRIVGVNWNVSDDIRLQDELRQAKQHAERQNGELENARRQMEHNALHDALTRLPNRRYLDQVLAEHNADADAQAPLTILHIDLDRFKDINDTLGHAAGDAILCHAAEVLRASVAPGDFVARIGGDEFVIVSRSDCDADHLAALATRIIEAMSAPFLYQGHECRAGASLGLATRSGADERAQDLLINADIALYEAKRRGRHRFEVFTDALRSSVVQTKQIADEILNGLERNEFIAYFQPQVDARSLEITGVEALVRWNHPERGILSPDRFLKIAESLNVVGALDQIVLEQALHHAGHWAASGLDIPKVSVNISAQRLHDPRLFFRLEALDIRPGSVCFELLESISFDEQDEAVIDTIQRIKALGIDIEIDDFGTGYASITSLLKLTPRRLKIDRQLIGPIVELPAARQIVASIIEIGKICGIATIAEGVETLSQAALLRDLGCDGLQGYAFARPMSGEALLAFAKARAWLPDSRDGRDGLLHRA